MKNKKRDISNVVFTNKSNKKVRKSIRNIKLLDGRIDNETKSNKQKEIMEKYKLDKVDFLSQDHNNINVYLSDNLTIHLLFNKFVKSVGVINLKNEEESKLFMTQLNHDIEKSIKDAINKWNKNNKYGVDNK